MGSLVAQTLAFLVHSLLIELPLDIGYSFHYMNTIPLIVEI